jgi:hypothetical protein
MLLKRISAVMLPNGTGGVAWALKSRLFFMALAYRLDAISQGPKKYRFPGPKPLPLALVMDAARIQSITHGPVTRINHRCKNSY